MEITLQITALMEGDQLALHRATTTATVITTGFGKNYYSKEKEISEEITEGIHKEKCKMQQKRERINREKSHPHSACSLLCTNSLNTQGVTHAL